MFWYGKVLESLFFFDPIIYQSSTVLNKWSKFRSNTGVDGNELDKCMKRKKNVNKCVDVCSSAEWKWDEMGNFRRKN